MINIYQTSLIEIQNLFDSEKLLEKLDQIYLSFDDILIDSEILPDEEFLLKLYYSAYQGLFASFKLMMMEIDVKKYFEMFAKIFEQISKINNTNLNSSELIFESIIAYYLSGNYVRAQVLSNDFEIFKLPNFKKYILSFLNKDFKRLRSEILNKFNSNEFNEKYIIEQMENNEINETDAFCKIFDFYILQSINYALNFVYSGDEKFIELSLDIIKKYKKISFDYDFIEYWWSFLILELLIKKLFTNSLWAQLNSFDENPNELTTLFIENKLNQSIIELLESQINAIELINDKNRANFCINTPTSSGKTLIAELTILQFLIDTDCSGKIIYISPFRSLSHEIEKKLKNSFKNFNLKISEFYGGFDSNLYEMTYLDDIDIFIVTPEKFDYIMRMNPQIRNDIGLIIIDEGHIIGESNDRGLNFEFFVYRIQSYYEDCRFVFISGVMPNIKDFSQLFSDSPNNIISSNWKPTDVYIGLLEWKDKNANITYLSKNGNKIKNPKKQLFYKHDDVKFIKQDNFQLALSALKLSINGPTFVYIRNKNEIETLANAIVMYSDILLNEYGISSKVDENDMDILEFKKRLIDEFGEESSYLKYIDLGFFIHHRDLPDDIKLKIEELFKLNKISLIIGTTTLINGVNFPIKNIVLKNLQMGHQYIDYHSFNNLCGRVGRAKIENSGRVFLYLSDLNKSNHQKNIDYLNELIDNKKNVNSIFHFLFEIFKENGIKLKKSENEIEFFEKTNDSITKMNEQHKLLIDNLDKQLLAFFEENKTNFTDDELITNVVNRSLFSIQSNNTEYMENLLQSRLYFIKKEYSSKYCRKIYECGLSLNDFDLINSNKEQICNYIQQLNYWQEYEPEEQEKLLFEIAIFISKLKMGSDLSKKENFELILMYWIRQYNITEIINILKENHNINANEKDIVAFINDSKYILPWGMTCILNYAINTCNMKILDICYQIVNMFKTGVFNLDMSNLMAILNDVSLCEELSKLIDVNSSIPDILFELNRISIRLISEKNRKKIVEFKTTSSDKFETLIIDNLNNFEMQLGDKFIIKKDNEKFLIYNLNGDYLYTYSTSNFTNIKYYCKINDINKIWVVNDIKNQTIYLN